MLAFLAGVPGKLKTILDRLTSTRAANLDNLDAAVSTRMPGSATEQGRIDVAISTRAPAATALTDVTWTDARAAKLDLITSASAAFASIQTGFVSGTVQTGTNEDARYVDITLATSLTDYTKALVILQGAWRHSTTGDPYAVPTGRLTSNTVLRVSTAFTSTAEVKVRYYVLELA